MTLNQVDTRGRSCPEPVLLAKKAIERFPEGVQVIADNTAAWNNIIRFAKNAGYNVETVKEGSDYILTLIRQD